MARQFQVKIRGRSYTLQTNEPPERMARIAESLDGKIADFARVMSDSSEAEIVTFAAFCIEEQNDGLNASVSELNAFGHECAAKIKQLTDENSFLKELNEENEEKLRDFEDNNKTNGQKLNDDNAAKLKQLREDYEAKIKQLDVEITELKTTLIEREAEHEAKLKQILEESINSAGSELNQLAMEKERKDNELHAKIQELENQLAERNSTETIETKRVLELKDKENEELRNKLIENEKEHEQYVKKVYTSAKEEFAQIAKVKERENIELYEAILKAERDWSAFAKTGEDNESDEYLQLALEKEKEKAELIERFVELEKAWNKHSMEVYNKAMEEADEVAEAANAEIERLKGVIENIQKASNEFTKLKKDEVFKLQYEIEELKLKLAEMSEDGQLTL